MLRRQCLRLETIVISIIMLMTVIGTAAPILRRSKTISDEVLSLSRLEAVRVIVKSPPAMQDKLHQLNISMARIRSQVVEQVVNSTGVEVVKTSGIDDQEPRLRVIILVRNSPDVNGAISIVIHLAIEQVVYIDRLQRHFVLPTYSLLENMLVLEEKASKEVHGVIPRLVNRVIRRVEQATVNLPAL